MARAGPGRRKNAAPASEKFFDRDCNLSDSAFIQKVIQLCDYLGKWLHLVGKSSHFLLPLIKNSTDRRYDSVGVFRCVVPMVPIHSSGAFRRRIFAVLGEPNDYLRAASKLPREPIFKIVLQRLQVDPEARLH